MSNWCKSFVTLSGAKGAVQDVKINISESVGYGTLRVSTVVESFRSTMLLCDVLCTQEMMYSLITISQTPKNKIKVIANNDSVDPKTAILDLMYKPFQEVNIVG